MKTVANLYSGSILAFPNSFWERPRPPQFPCRSQLKIYAALFLLLVPLKADPDAAPTPTPAPALAPATTWRQAIDPWTWQFPRDHGAHPDFKTEWWYFTGNLQDSVERKFRLSQLTIFRQGDPVQAGPARQQMGGARFLFRPSHDQRSGRGKISCGGTGDPWRAGRSGGGDRSHGRGARPVDDSSRTRTERIHLSAREDDISIDLTLSAR